MTITLSNAATIHTAGHMYRQIRHVHMANEKVGTFVPWNESSWVRKFHESFVHLEAKKLDQPGFVFLPKYLNKESVTLLHNSCP